MKKNIFLILICICVFCINVSGVRAVSDNGISYKLAMQGTYSVEIPSLHKSGSFFVDTINGAPAFCIELGRPAKNGDFYQNSGIILSHPAITSAYNYSLIAGNDTNSKLAAQVYIWSFIEKGESGLLLFPLAYKEACVSANKNNPEFSGAEGRQRLENECTNLGLISQLSIPATEPYSEPLCKFVSLGTRYRGNTVTGQAMVAPCTNMGVYACDDGTMQQEVTDCTNGLVNSGYSLDNALASCKNQFCQSTNITGACKNGQIKENGSIPQCSDDNSSVQANFNTSATVGSNASIHQNYGQVENVANLSKYCKLYCLETASVILPGGFANALTSGTNVVWPTSANTESSPFGNIFPLYFSGKKTCHLAIGDRNAPQGSSAEGDCNLDPLGTYNNYYDRTVTLGNRTTDLDGRTYEKVRTYEGNYYTDESYCGDLGAERGRNFKYYVANNSGHYTKHSDKANNLRSALKYAADVAQSCHDNPACHYNSCCTAGTHEENCETDPITGKTFGCDDVCNAPERPDPQCGESGEYNRKVSAYNSARSNLNTVENSINACKDYINQFNATRELANEIAKCYNFEINACNAGSSNQDDCIYNFKASATLNFEDSEYSMSDVLKQVNDVRYDCDGCSVSSKMQNKSNTYTLNGINRLYNKDEMDRKIREIQARTIKISTNNVKFELNSPYKYVDKKTNQPLTSPTDNSVSLGYSFLPLSHNNILGKKYNIGLSNIVFGDTAAGSNVATFEASNDYVCHYSVTGTNDECLCPEGTENAGEDLFYFVKTESLTCADAKLKYCDATGTDFSDDKSEKYCPNDMTKKITACLNSGYSYNYCVDLICVGSVDSAYHCKNTNGVSGAMDITSCVYTKMAQGYSLQESIDECDSLICPLAGGIKIIYRTISLRNPFPGKDIAKQVNGFNQDVKGRYPGTNWNSLELVKNEILYNRGVEGNSVYKKEPLYRFELSPSTMKAIRNYNDTRDAAGGYADYTLNCRNNNSTACVSSFVHNAEYGLIGGTCANATSKNNFYTCSQ